MTDAEVNEQRVQAQVDRLLAALLALGVAEMRNEPESLAGFVLGFRQGSGMNVNAGRLLIASVFDALAELADAVRDHCLQEFNHE